MIFKRVVAGLRAQNWRAIAIELAIVIVGVFVGTQVSNWNAQRIAKAETEQMLAQFTPELSNQLSLYDTNRAYYATTRRFAEEAFAGWRGDPKVSDAQFVIAAYQASQITGIGLNADAWSFAFGGERIRNIEDRRVRRLLEIILTSDYSSVNFSTVATAYREQVRHVIPNHLQDAIRRECGDRTRRLPGGFNVVDLSRTCDVRIAPGDAAAAAAALRARPELASELNWHLAAVATYLQNFEGLVTPMRDLLALLEHASQSGRAS